MADGRTVAERTFSLVEWQKSHSTVVTAAGTPPRAEGGRPRSNEGCFANAMEKSGLPRFTRNDRQRKDFSLWFEMTSSVPQGDAG